MIRLLAAAIAALSLLPAAARAQGVKKEEGTPAAQQPAAQQPVTQQAPAPQTELDAKTKAAIQAAIEKAKEDLRNEVRAEMQGLQSAAEWGAVSEGPKLELFEVDGYFRTRGDMFDDLDLRRPLDTSGYYIFPRPAQQPESRGTLATANMRFRLEPTLNVSEQIRVRSQVDILDNYVLGSSVSKLMNSAGSPYSVPFWGAGRALYEDDPTADRAAILPKRAWGEAQTPVGLLSFGRMPSHWGLGMLANAGQDVDDDFGDTVDRIQFALAPVSTPVGSLVFVPILDFDAEGVLYKDQRFGNGLGQPFDAEQGDDARTLALKIARIDTDDEIRRKLERNESSFNFGVYYNYRTQRWLFPYWYDPSLAPAGTTIDPSNSTQWIARRAYGHILDLWARFRSGRLRVEGEIAGVYGQIGNGRFDVSPNGVDTPRLILRQWGGAVQTDFDALPNKFSFGGDAGIASGDDAPGFGNIPDRTSADGYTFGPGSFEGPQWGLNGDHSIRNFRFNPAYRVDLVFWREIMGNVTDAWYVRPHLRWNIFAGLSFQAAAIYSQAVYGTSTPSYTATGSGYKPLGVELDGKLSYASGDGFMAWLDYGVFQPLNGFNHPDKTSLARAHALRAGLAIKF